MQILKQSTAVTVKIGPFLDETNGKDAETTLTISQADVRLSKNGGDIAQKTESTSCTHDELGIYGCPLDTTDTGTLGRLQLWVHESGALPVWHEYMVVTANVYDTLFSTDKFDVNLASMDDIDLSATMKTSVNAEVDTALNTAIPGSPTADSVNERVKAMDDLSQASGAGDLAAIKTEVDTHPTLAEIEASSVLAVEATLTAIKGTGFDTATDSLVKIHDDHVTHLSAAPALASVCTEARLAELGSTNIPADIDKILKCEKNRWKILSNQLIIYDNDGSTPLYTFNLKDSAGDPAMENVYERVPA